MSKFYRDRIHKARLYVDRSFHSSVTLQRLARWGLGLEPSIEALAYELTVFRRESSFFFFLFFFLFILRNFPSIV